MTETLELPVVGRTYRVPSPPAAIGLALQASWVISQARRKGTEPPRYALDRVARYDDTSRSIDEDALGPVWGQMIDDGVDYATLKRAAMAAYLWVVTGSTDTALAYFTPDQPNTGEGERSGEARTRSTGTGGATKTRKRASTSGTTSRKAKSAD